MERRRRGRRSKLTAVIIILVLLTGLGAAGFFIYKEFKITTINISGSDKYTYEELYQYIFEKRSDSNILLFKYTDSKNPMPEIPFIAKVDIEITDSHTLEVTVYEKSLVGYVSYKGNNMYFDKDGVIVESSAQVINGVPEVTGLEFDYIVLHEKLEVPDVQVFQTLLDITQYLDKYSIVMETINVEEDGSIDIMIGDVLVKLGQNDYNMGNRIYELSCMIEELKGMKGTLHLDEYTEGTEYITFTETE